MIAEKYINPFTDFGFKKIFGEEANKDLLIDFLNELLTDKGKIIDITYLKSEHLGTTELDRKAIFDIYCETDKGEKFIVEMQRAKQDYFKDRSLYYLTFPIQEQAVKGGWNYQLSPVYSVAIMDFVFDHDQPDKLLHDVWLMDRLTQKIFYEKLRFLFIEIKKFEKNLADCHSHFDKWLYVLKNLSRLDGLPAALQEEVFTKLFKVASIASYDPKQLQAYRDSEKNYLDFMASIKTSFKEGLVEGEKMGIEKEKIKIALKMKSEGFTTAQIAKITGLAEQEILAL